MSDENNAVADPPKRGRPAKAAPKPRRNFAAECVRLDTNRGIALMLVEQLPQLPETAPVVNAIKKLLAAEAKE